MSYLEALNYYAAHTLLTTTIGRAAKNVSSAQFSESDLVVPDSPQLPEKSPSKSLGAVAHSGTSSGRWTAPVIKKIDVSASAAQGKCYITPAP